MSSSVFLLARSPKRICEQPLAPVSQLRQLGPESAHELVDGCVLWVRSTMQVVVDGSAAAGLSGMFVRVSRERPDEKKDEDEDDDGGGEASMGSPASSTR